MKKLVIFLFLVFCFSSMVFASIDVYNYSVENSYYSMDVLRGNASMSIQDEYCNELVESNNGDGMELLDFIKGSGNIYDCFPADCSSSYGFSAGADLKKINIPLSGEKYAGFVLTGNPVVLTNMSFKITSDFSEGDKHPLTINFFEGDEWEFDRFSDVSFLEENWGCYDNSAGGVGAKIMPSILYCENIIVSDSSKLYVGAKVNLSGVGNLTMTVIDAGVGRVECSYDPHTESGCLVFPDGDVFSGHNYEICVGAPVQTNYRIYNESVGQNCGFVSGIEGASVKDYAIFAKGLKYASANILSSLTFNDSKFVNDANSYIEKRYNKDCSDSCVLPLVFSGVPQEITVYSVFLEYGNPEYASTNKVYNLVSSPARVSSEGLFDLGALGFRISESMDYTVSVAGVDIFEEDFIVVSLPFVTSVSPLNPPAGVPIDFYANIDFEGNKSLTYFWDFGDGSTATTVLPSANHMYAELKDYTLSLQVSAGGNLTTKKNFNIKTISPIAAVNSELSLKYNALEKIVSKIKPKSFWYEDKLLDYLRTDFFKDELDKLNKKRNESTTESDFVPIAKDLYGLDVPRDVVFKSFRGSFFLTKSEEINVDLIRSLGGSGSGSNSDYAKAILGWQNSNIDFSFDQKEIGVQYWSGKSGGNFGEYSLKVNSRSNIESYFVISRPLSQLHFRKDIAAQDKGGYTIIPMGANSQNSFEFYYEDTNPVSFFVSPELSSIILDSDIDSSCNYNLVCESELGESVESCRSDCKPFVRAIIYIVLILFFVFIIYSILQIWYKRRYEGFLFRDRKQLYNLLMFVTNAGARGLSDYRIGAELRAQGWSSERVNYIIKKSKGERTGLYEIVPFEKIAAYFRNRKARKTEANRVATAFQQQDGRNINKSWFPMR